MKTAGKQHKADWRCRLSDWRRRGAAAVELAVVSPVLLLTAIGIIDVGQFVSVGQIVNNASREGARLAIRSDTEWGSEVEAAILTYMTDAIGGVSPDTINSALKVEVTDRITDENGTAIWRTVADGDLALVDSGSEIRVVVTFDYASIRWAANSFFDATTEIAATTIMRRD